MSLPKLTLVRTYIPNDRTLGYILEEPSVVTLERSWERNKVSVSCIPEGTYTVLRDRTGRFQYFAVQNVPGRTAIELHGGNLPEHSEGCILIGSFHDNKYNLKGSEKALEHLMLKYPNGFELTIKQLTPDTVII